jgi:hypothetical protein
MSSAKRLTALLAIIALVLLGAVVLRFASSSSRPETVAPFAKPDVPAEAADTTRTVSQMPRPTSKESEEEEADGEGLPRIPREKVEEFLQLRNRSAASLLAGFHALKDTNLLYEAAAEFPNDPQVQWTMLMQDLKPEDRRKWLDMFKVSSPDNSLANYLSAAEHFKSGKPEDAIKELLDASGKKQFKDYAMAAMLDEQELSRFAGLTPLETLHVNGWGSELIAQLPAMKVVAKGIAEARTQYVQAGDTASADTLVQAGFGLAGRMTEGEGGRFVINHMVGIAIEAIMLNQLQADARYDFLGGKTPTERLAELKQQRTDFKSLNTSLASAYANMSEADWMSYSDRLKTYGEVEAVKWLQQRVANRAGPGR